MQEFLIQHKTVVPSNNGIEGANGQVPSIVQLVPYTGCLHHQLRQL